MEPRKLTLEYFPYYLNDSFKKWVGAVIYDGEQIFEAEATDLETVMWKIRDYIWSKDSIISDSWKNQINEEEPN